jgi:hypothetical protein
LGAIVIKLLRCPQGYFAPAASAGGFLDKPTLRRRNLRKDVD